MSRISKAKQILWTILGIALAVAVTRFIFGLGATTNLTDNTPWGFWIGFDVMGGVALAAGGFVIASFNYIFHKKAFHAVSRAAILTAFLGYIAVAVGLLFDLGLPWNIWHMIIYWNPHSPLFEVGWCVMLYLTVLLLEFTPVVLEKYPGIKLLKKIYDLLYKIRIPLVIAGIMLSTLHQSSLGSLFLAMPYRLHPLWYSPIIPIIFFISAICLGLMMVMLESSVSSWLYRKEPEYDVLKKLSSAAVFMLIFYAIARFADILLRGAGVFLFEASWGTFLFWAELAMSVIIPAIIFAIPYCKRNANWLFWGALIGVMGVVFNRLNVGGLTHLNNLSDIGRFYFPSWMELTISAGVVSAAMLCFFYFIENYKVWEVPPVNPEDDPILKPKFNIHKTYFGPTKAANRTIYSLSFVFAFAIAFSAISGEKINSDGYEKVKATKARGGDTLLIDGNKDGYTVVFKHKFHTEKGITCGVCHHINKPDDKSTSCYECHNYMYTKGDAFRHNWHASSAGANLKCFSCHTQSQSKSKFTAKKCSDCHKNLIPPDATMKELPSYVTVSYVDAMHSACISCHEKSLAADTALRARKPNLAQCSNCHPAAAPHKYEKKMFERIERNKWVVLPAKFK